MRIIRIAAASVSAVLPPSLVAALVQHYEQLVEHVRRRFRDRGFARDVVHDVCVELMAHPPTQAVHTPLAFLRQVSTHRAIDRQRSEALRADVVLAVGDTPDTACHAEDGAAALDFRQQLDALVSLVEALPPRARQCFLLHRVHGMRHDEIAAAIGVTRSMVTHHVNRAMDRIAREWAPARERR